MRKEFEHTRVKRSGRILEKLQRYESRNVTQIEADGSWPIVWERARDTWVWDVDGRRYLDLTAAFGVAAAGHANARVVRAGQKQMKRLLHAMGDVHPHPLKARLAEVLSDLTFGRWSEGRKSKKTGKTIFCNSGFEAVEAAMKTAALATGKAELIAFSGAYHGTGYGTLTLTHRDYFSRPFRNQVRRITHFVPFPVTTSDANRTEAEIRRRLKTGRIGAVVMEPIQVRGGICLPADGFLPRLRKICDTAGALMILDEIYTGFGRTGRWFAVEHSGVTPDLICLGKAMTGGFPLSACVGEARMMDRAWPESRGEALHTSTFLGHPVGCAMALAQIGEIRDRKLVQRSGELGDYLLNALGGLAGELRGRGRLALEVRGRGLLAGVELFRGGRRAGAEAMAIIRQMLRNGFILLPEGPAGNVISFSPPLTISKTQIDRAVVALKAALGK